MFLLIFFYVILNHMKFVLFYDFPNLVDYASVLSVTKHVSLVGFEALWIKMIRLWLPIFETTSMTEFVKLFDVVVAIIVRQYVTHYFSLCCFYCYNSNTFIFRFWWFCIRIGIKIIFLNVVFQLYYSSRFFLISYKISMLVRNVVLMHTFL